MEPPKQKLPEGVVHREVRLYGIVGWFTQPLLYTNTSFAFGGYFKWDKETGKMVDGQLVDSFGVSEIEGVVDFMKGTMEFTKRYGSKEIQYEFKRCKDAMYWEGTWRQAVRSSTGPVFDHGEAKANLIWGEGEAFQICCGPPRLTNPYPTGELKHEDHKNTQ